MSKKMFATESIPVAKDRCIRITEGSDLNKLAQELNKQFEFPFIVKPNREGSTVGLSIVKNEKETKESIKLASHSDEFILIEQFIDGMELTVPVLGKKDEERALPIIEIVPKNEIYDYESKYSDGGSEHIIPARISDALTEKIQDYAVKAHQVLGCETYSRVDFLLTKDGIPYILEVNTLPGMTPTSLFPNAAKKDGLPYDDMVETLVQLTKEAYQK